MLVVLSSHEAKAHIKYSVVASHTNSVQQGHVELVDLGRRINLNDVWVLLDHSKAIRVCKEEIAHTAFVIVLIFVPVLCIISATFSDLKVLQEIKENFNIAMASKIRSYKFVHLILDI